MEKMCISSDCFCFLANTITHNSSRVSRATKVRVGQSWIKIYSRFSRGYTFHPHNYRRRWGKKLATVELAQVVLCDWIYNNEWEFGGGKKFFSAGKAVCSFPPHHHFFFQRYLVNFSGLLYANSFAIPGRTGCTLCTDDRGTTTFPRMTWQRFHHGESDAIVVAAEAGWCSPEWVNSRLLTRKVCGARISFVGLQLGLFWVFIHLIFLKLFRFLKVILSQISFFKKIDECKNKDCIWIIWWFVILRCSNLFNIS